MSKSVLLSIHPKWCELIVSGKKTVEIRKTKPKIETPFKCYIYCTTTGDLCYKSNNDGKIRITKNTLSRVKALSMTHQTFLNGTIIGELMCDRIEEIRQREVFDAHALTDMSCLTIKEFLDYIGNKTAYLWHISDLVIYDWPRALCLFNHPHYKDCDIECGNCKYGFPTDELSFEDYICDRALQRAPQSWCYVEEAK